jgi:predicted acetyltransferase
MGLIFWFLESGKNPNEVMGFIKKFKIVKIVLEFTGEIGYDVRRNEGVRRLGVG